MCVSVAPKCSLLDCYLTLLPLSVINALILWIWDKEVPFGAIPLIFAQLLGFQKVIYCSTAAGT